MGKPRPWEPVICDDVALIPLTQGKWAVIDSDDVPLVLGPPWQAYQPSIREDRFYASARPPGPRTTLRRKMHRVIMGLERGDPRTVDHVNGDGLDNRRSNLRVASTSQNLMNRGRQANNHSSAYKGVTRTASGKWEAAIQVNGRRWRRNFESEVEAARQYDEWAVVLHGGFAFLNFPAVSR